MNMSESKNKIITNLTKTIGDCAKKIDNLQRIIRNVKERYGFRSCQLCDDLYDTHEYSRCPECPCCSACEQTVEQLYDNGNGDEWCGECIGHRHDIDDLVRDYRDSR